MALRACACQAALTSRLSFVCPSCLPVLSVCLSARLVLSVCLSVVSCLSVCLCACAGQVSRIARGLRLLRDDATVAERAKELGRMREEKEALEHERAKAQAELEELRKVCVALASSSEIRV
eukprot:3316849-Rhodomonas_salina.2